MEAEAERGAGASERTRAGCHLASPAIDRILSREGTSGAQIKDPEEDPDSAEQTTCKKCAAGVRHHEVSISLQVCFFCSPYAWERFHANAPQPTGPQGGAIST